MSTFGSNLELHEKIGNSLNKLTNSELSILELEELLGFSRELYERILVLRFKAFENQVHSEQHVTLPKLEEPKQPVVEELIVPDEPPAIEFALFGEIHDDVVPTISTSFAENEVVLEKNEAPKIVEEQKAILEKQSIVPEVKHETRANQTPSGTSLLDKLSTSNASNRLGDQLKKSHIESLMAVLNLNDRIRFTKNLFDGNSDTFNAAIQLLDAQKSIAEAQDLLSQYATRYEWNIEDKNTLDFYEFVERRYA
jgi:hypothetical protein